MREVSLQQIFALVPATCNRYLNFAMYALDDTLTQLPEVKIVWPDALRMGEYSDLIVCKHSNKLRSAFGFVDGLNLPIQVSSDEEVENACFNGWLHSHMVSSVLAYAPTGAFHSFIYITTSLTIF